MIGSQAFPGGFEAMDQKNVLRGLVARLELDADLGVDFLTRSQDGIHQLEMLADSASQYTPENKTARYSPRHPTSSQEQGDEQPSHDSTASQTGSRPAASGSRESGTDSRERAYVSDTQLLRQRLSLVPLSESPPHPEKEAALADLKKECLACSMCALCQKRHSVVWGEGNLDADVLFIGEGPGRDEDAEGRPFVGRSGRLLTDIIEKGMKMPRSHVYIANVVKCRPPGNRDPHPEEVEACSRYLNRQIEVIAPKVIVAVGSIAGKTLLQTDSQSSLRGRWHSYGNTPMRVIYHPSYLLRLRRTESDRTSADLTTWRDIQEVMSKAQE